MKRRLILTLLAIIAALISGCATTGQISEQIKQPETASATVITGLKIMDNAVEVKTDGPFIYTIYKSADPYRVTLEIPEVSVGPYNEKIISKNTGISEVAPSQITEPKLTTRIEIQLQTPSELEPVYRDNVLTLKIKEPLETIAEVLAASDASESLITPEDEGEGDTEEDQVQSEIQTEVKNQGTHKAEAQQKIQLQNRIKDREDAKGKGSETLPESLTEGKYTGRKISLDFQDTDIVPIFRLLADISGYNIVLNQDVKGKLTMKLINVPWDQALDLILKDFSLGKSVEGNIIRIAPLSVFAKESEELVRARDAEVKAEPLETRIFPINYADVSVVENTIKNSKLLTTRGSLSVDKRTSSMVIKDAASVFPQIENLLTTLDRAIPQVMIEARIVEINTSDTSDLGIQWGLNLSAKNTLSAFGGNPGLGKGSFTGGNYLVDFPSGSSGPGSGSGFNFGILTPARTLGLDLQISALEKIGKSRIVSNPRIVTTDNIEAMIMQGTSEPFPQIDATSGQISTVYKDVALTTKVTPHITPSGAINMIITVRKEDIIGSVKIGGSDVPRTSKIEGNTNVLVQNGETIVIGGVYKKTESKSSAGIPGLMKIPLLGELFKSKVDKYDTAELLIFITPRIIEKP